MKAKIMGMSGVMKPPAYFKPTLKQQHGLIKPLFLAGGEQAMLSIMI